MRQYLFQIPFSDRLLPPDGWWLPGYGACLLAAFIFVVWWGSRRSIKVGLPGPKLQDMAILLFVTGILGARALYMYQYFDQFPDHSIPGLALGFVSIWKGGLVVYGSVFGGLIGYLFFRHYVLKPMKVNGWQLADVAAPLLALGMAVGRIGCYLNGCCWGQVAIVECQPVPLGSEWGQFPLIPSHAKDQLCLTPGRDARLPQICGLQTRVGFTLAPNDPAGIADPRTIDRLEPGSDALKADLKPGDVIVKVNDVPNAILLTVRGPKETLAVAKPLLGNAMLEDNDGTVLLAGYESLADYKAARVKLAVLPVTLTYRDHLWELLDHWPKGGSELRLEVDRGGTVMPINYTPKTVTFFPTQIYETVSMLLLTLVLVAFQPFRRHDGQVIVLMMLGYAAHRFLNEAIRIEPTYAMGLTLSQWISVLIFVAGLALEVYLRKSQPKLPAGLQPLGVNPV
ncbi:hypothetical protein BH11PLA2_BH11PLA2_42560 [soil metagenome]